METLTMTDLASRIPTEAAAWKYLEKRRWKDRPVCPHCGGKRVKQEVAAFSAVTSKKS